MDASLTSAGGFALLGLGLIFGLKHATEVDHVVAVSTIVAQNRSLLRSAMVGALWGAGHTASLLITGAIVLSLRVTIPEKISNWLEFCVALMILGLGVSALWRVLRKGREVHVHNQVGMAGSALSRNLRGWLDRRYAADVRLNRIAFYLDLAKRVWISSLATDCCGGTEHRFWIVVCL